MCQFCEANNQSAKLLTRNLIHKKKTTEFNIILLILKRNRKGDTKITGLIPEIQSFQMAVTKKQSIQSSRLYSKKFHSSINFIINSLLYDLIIHLKQFRTRFCAILEFQSSFRASEQFQSNFRAVSDQILSNFRVSEQFHSIFRVVLELIRISEHFQSTFRDSEQSKSSFRVSEQFKSSFRVSEHFQSSSIARSEIQSSFRAV